MKTQNKIHKTRSSKLVRLLCVLCLTTCALSTWAEVWSYTAPAVTSNSFFTAAQNRLALGYRAVSLSCTSNRISAVWLRDYKPAELQVCVPYEALQSNVMVLQAKGYRLVNVAVYGQIPTESYLVSYVKDGKQSSLFTRLSASELIALASATPGSRVSWIQSSGVGPDARYAGVLADDGLLGKLEIALEKTALDSKISSYGETGYRPVCVVGVAGATGMVYTANWVQESKRWTNGLGMSAGECTMFITSLVPQKLRADVITQYLAEDQQTPLFSAVGVEDLPPIWTVTGNVDPGLEEFDRAMTNAMRRANCTRASLAVSKNGRLMLSRGYTHHPESLAATQPTNLFRIASISKTITAVTVMGLVEAGRLQLDDRLGKFIDLSGVTDPRWTNITVRHLLQHRGGWNRDTTFDPMLYDESISTALHVPLPITKGDIIAYMKKQRLQANPGSTYSYSNFGYLLLSRIIEKVTGQDYEAFVRQNVLAPLGIHAARLGRTARVDQLPGEVEYEEGASTYPSVLSSNRPTVAYPYGWFNLENMDSHGGWVFSAEDLVRFGSTFTERTNCALLFSNTIDVLWAPAPQEPPLPTNGWYSYYGLGWGVAGINQGPPSYALHGGSLPGTSTLLVRQSDGYCWAVLFNTLNEGGIDPLTALGLSNLFLAFSRVDDAAVVKAIAAVTQWPTNDLFDTDTDGLPDSYEIAQFGSLSASNGSGDWDGDGLSDAAEWVAMSSPVDAADGPRLNIRSDVDGNRFLEVATRGGRVYSVYAISALGQSWDTSTVLTQFNGDGFTRAIRLNPTEPSRFYRLGVSLRAKPLSPRP